MKPTKNNSRFSALPLAFTAAVALLTPATFAQGWLTVDDFQYVPAESTYTYGLTTAPNGRLFACGFGYDAAGVAHGLVIASGDGGNTWSGPVDDFVYPGLSYTRYEAGIVADSVGNLYVAGRAYDDGSPSGGPFHWIVRRSTDGGETWSLADDFIPGGSGTEPYGITVDAAGNLYVAGDADYNASGQYWTVRKGIGGTNFFTVDNFPDGSYYTALTVFAHPTAGIFTAGEGPVATNKFGNVTYGWLVRRSTNGGTNWTTADAFVLASGYRANPFGIGTDTNGNLYVAGRAASQYKGSGYFHWLVRKGNNTGTSWTTDDNYQLFVTGTQSARGFSCDSAGNLYAVGGAGAKSYLGPTDWLVRKKVAGTSTWVTLDDFKFGAYAGAQSIAINMLGSVLVGGSGSDGTSDHWLIRKK
jgi:hypothetical protein